MSPSSFTLSAGCGPARRRGHRLEQCAARRPRHVDRADDVLARARPDRRRAAARRAGSARRSAAARSGAGQSVRRRGCAAAASRSSAATAPIPPGFLRVAAPGLLVIGYRSNPSARRAGGGEVQSVSEGRGARRGRRAASAPQRDRARSARDLLALREEPGACRDRRARRRATGRSASRSSSSPNGIRTRFAPVRIFPFA